MADTLPDEGPTAAQVATPDGQGAPADKADNADAKTFMLNFGDKDSAEKGFKELQGFATRVAQENAALREQTKELIATLGKAVPAKAAEQPAQLDDSEILKRITDAENPYAEMLKIVKQVGMDAYELATQQVGKELTALKEMVGELDPGFQQNRETVTRLMKEYGVSREQAVKIAAKELAAKGATETRSTQTVRRPGSVRQVAVVQGDDDGTEVPDLTPTERAFIAGLKMTPEAKKELEAEVRAGKRRK